MNVSAEPVKVPSEDGEAQLVFADGWLVAVLVQLGSQQGDLVGRWFLEKGFDSLDRPQHPMFPDLDAALAWIRSELADSPRLKLRSGG